MSEQSNLVDLKEHLLRIIAEREEKYQVRFAGLENAIVLAARNIHESTQKAEIAMEKRLNSLNEFRGQMGDMQSTFARKAEVEIRLDALDNKIEGAISQLHRTAGRDTGLHSAWVILAAIAALIIAALGIWMR